MNLAAAVPRLETESLLLRGHRMEDFASTAALWADPLVTRHILERPLSEEEAWSRFLRYAGHWSALGFGYWLIEEKHTGKFIGEAGFADYKRQIEPSLNGAPEIGWVLASAAHGKGFATEAVRKLTAWADDRFRARTVCIIAPQNELSVRVAEKCGYRQQNQSTYHAKPILIFARDPASSAL